MTRLESITERLFPARCFLCGSVTGGRALCFSCMQKWNKAVASGKAWEKYSLRGVDLLFTMSPYSKDNGDVVSAYLRRAKKVYRTHAVAFAAGEAVSHLVRNTERVWRDVTVVPVPRSSRAVRKYGFDQAVLLARQIARELNCPYCEALCHTGSTKQKALNRELRQHNASASYSIRDGAIPAIRDRHILLVDDVVTTGATMAACASLLRASGALSVDAFAMARTPK